MLVTHLSRSPLLLLPSALSVAHAACLQTYCLREENLSRLHVCGKLVPTFFKELPCEVNLAVFVDGRRQGALPELQQCKPC
jgi:hypothetical protein